MRTAILLVLLVACGKGGEAENKTVEPAVGSAGSAAAPAPPAAPPDAAMAAAAPGAMSPKIKAARCGEPCLFLVDTPYAKLLGTYKAECGGMETKDLGYDDCKKLDYMRNCIYAAHGLVFKKKKWKQFTTKPWYEAHADFDAKTIGELERANVHELNQRGKACKKGFSISGGDYEKVSAWFKAFPKNPAMPKLVYFGPDPTKPAEFITTLKEELSHTTQDPIRLKKGEATVMYVDNLSDDGSEGQAAPEVIKAVKAAKGRLVVVDFDAGTVGTEDNPISEGTYVWFAFDDKGDVIAIAAAHYLYD